MNSPYDVLITAQQAALVLSGGICRLAVAVQDAPVLSGFPVGTQTYTPAAPVSAGVSTLEKPAWRNYWAQIYQKYTVLGAKWKIVASSPVRNVSGTLIAWEYDSYAAAAGNILPDVNPTRLYAFKGINYKTVGTRTTNDNRDYMQIIEGQYKPGDVRRNIQNDGDVKLWTDKGGAPVFIESLHMRFYKDPMNVQYVGALGTDLAGVNLDIQIDYIVQWKDPEEPARYPYTQTPIVQTLPNDAVTQ